MKQISILTFFICCSIYTSAQKTAIHGEVFTPKGDLRALIIFAGFDGYDAKQDFPNWTAEKEFPEYVKNGKCDELFFTDTLQFQNIKDSNNLSVSRLFYEMSYPNNTFRFMADVYPSRINLNPKHINSWSEMNLNVIKNLQKIDPKFDWSPYDQRKNRPNYMFDNSKTEPDGKPDYVIICYRYDKNWEKQPNPSMPYWQGSGGGISVLEGVNNFIFNDSITVTSDGFHMNTVGLQSTENFRRLFQHELGHELLSCPHHFGTGGTIGSYFRTATMGWGTAVNSASCTRLINAWERWMLGWIELKHDLRTFEDNGIYTLDDYATTGEAIRIKIPNTKSQYLWIENHQLRSVFDQSRWDKELINTPPGSAGMTNIDAGLYFFVEDLMDEREKIRTYLVSDMQAVNGAKFLNANGNWDYTTVGEPTKSWAEYWNNTLYTFERQEENPYDGINPFLLYRMDANKDGQIENNHNFNMARNSESFPIVKEKVGDTTFLFYGNHACTNADAKPYRRTHSFVEGDTLSMSHNPPISNNPRYNENKHQSEAVFINGLKVVVLKNEHGKYTIFVQFDNNQVNKNLRISGNVAVKNIPHTEVDMDIAPNVRLLVNKSGTINTLNPLDGSFINETRFLIDSAHVFFRENAQMQLLDSSIVLFGSGSTLSLTWNNLNILEKSGLYFASGSKINLDDKTIVFCDKNATIVLQKGTLVNDLLLKQDITLPKEDPCSGEQLIHKLKKLNK